MSRHSRTLAVVCFSAGTLAYEILLVRVFAIQHFHHFAYMAIGIAMLGFGVSGTMLALIPRRDRRTTTRWFFGASVLTPLALIASPALVHQVTLDPTQLVWNLHQWLHLSVIYLLLALPFVVGALAVLLALTLEPQRPGRIYGASFLGSGLGAVLAIAVLWLLTPQHALALPAVVASLGTLAAATGAERRSRALGWGGLVGVLGLIALVYPPWRLSLTPYKALPQVEAYPDAVRVAERSSPLGWVVAVSAPAFRYAPGLSLKFRGMLPQQTGLFVDGQLVGAATAWVDRQSAFETLDMLPSAMPYVLGSRDNVLVIGAGAGTEIANALVHGARYVTAVELNPDIVELARQYGGLPPRANRPATGSVHWVVGDARHYVASSRERFDLITLGPGGTFGAATAGVYALGEDFLYTEQAYDDYLARLSDDGVLSVTGWLVIPPRTNVRTILTAVDALRRAVPHGVADALVVARSWGTVTVMAKPSGFTGEEIDALGSWAAARNFDLDWHPGAGAPADVFNMLDEPTFFDAARAAVAGTDDAFRFAESYPFDVAPVGDTRPYPHHHLRVRSLGTLLGSDRGSWLPFAEWGLVALLATLVQSVVLAGLLLVLPVVVRTRRTKEPDLLRVVLYFSAIGLAYLTAEIAAIQQVGLLLGHPVYAVAAVLTVFLICSGVGSAWSDRFDAPRVWRVGVVLMLTVAVYAVALPHVVHLLQPTPLLVRGIVAMMLLGPLAFVMGMPFPLGLRVLARDDSKRIAWAWAANGFASVTSAPLAALLALEFGAPAVLATGAVAYGVAGAIGRNRL